MAWTKCSGRLGPKQSIFEIESFLVLVGEELVQGQGRLQQMVERLGQETKVRSNFHVLSDCLMINNELSGS